MSQGKSNLAHVLGNANFRLLWTGQGTSLLGDQFFLLAVPWLVLKLTGDLLALGTVMALTGIPRVLFMLVGGVASDRISPRRIMIVSDVLRLLLTAAIAVMVLTGSIQLWVLYIFAILFGTISGFFTPASSAMMPQLVDADDLQAGNSLFQGTSQLSVFLGPVLAGGLIGWFAHAHFGSNLSGSAEMLGIAIALGFDALTFLISVVTLGCMKLAMSQSCGASLKGGILASIQAGMRYAWTDPLLRVVLMLMVAANFLFVGPLLIGIPVLASDRLPGGASAYGLIMGAYGFGNLLGILVAGGKSRWFSQNLGQVLIGTITVFAGGLVLLGYAASTPAAFTVLLVMGIGNGCLFVTAITSLQRRTPKEMLGRIMSLIMLANVGLVPISEAVTGAAIKVSLTGVFVTAGCLMALVAVWLALEPAVKSMGLSLSAEGAR